MAKCYVRQRNGQCRVEHSGGAGNDVPVGVVISASVGANGANRKADVLAIQEGLNRLEPADGRPVPELKLDGICGPKTLAAIRKFQKEQCGFRWPDERIEPGRKTHQRLNELLGSAPAAAKAKAGGTPAGAPKIGLPPNPYIKPYMLSLLPLALKAVRCAEAHLQAAWPVINNPDVSAGAIGASRAESVRLINLHFQVDKLASRQSVINRLLDVYRTMQRVFVRPGYLWGEYVFDDDPFPKAHMNDLAYTFAGGYYLSGKKNPKPREQRLDTIYFCDQLASESREHSVITLVHELAHFVGSTVPGRDIDDFATYGWVTAPQMQKLPPALRIRHAESFANFALDSLPAGA